MAKNVYDYLKGGVNWYKDGGSKYRVRRDEEISGDSLYVLKNTKMPAVLVEYGFMDNYEDFYHLLKWEKCRSSEMYIANVDYDQSYCYLQIIKYTN